MADQKIKVRKLLKSDQKKMSVIFSRLADTIDDDSIRNIISNSRSGSGDAAISEEQRITNIIRVFIELFKKAASHLADDVSAFLAELIGVTPEEYQDLPLDIDVQILEQLKESPEVENFFTGASRTFSGTEWSKKLFKTLKEKYASITE